MAAAAYRLLGFAVWAGVRWYARRRLVRARRVLRAARVAVPVAIAGLTVARAIVRRLAGSGRATSGPGDTFVR